MEEKNNLFSINFYRIPVSSPGRPTPPGRYCFIRDVPSICKFPIGYFKSICCKSQKQTSNYVKNAH